MDYIPIDFVLTTINKNLKFVSMYTNQIGEISWQFHQLPCDWDACLQSNVNEKWETPYVIP